MFASLREKLTNVQEEITTSLRNLKIGEDSRISKGKKKKIKYEEDCNFDAGLDLLERYASYWTEIHSKTAITALCAAEVDELVQALYENYETQWRKVAKLSGTLALIPQVSHGVQQVCDSILNLQCAFEETEDALLALEDLIETQELREKELDHRFQLALYGEKRLGELEDLKASLTDDHLRKIREFEKKKEALVKEKQDQLQQAFNKDLQQYKSAGIVPKSTSTPSVQSTPSLEEIMLNEDTHELESFLTEEDIVLEEEETTTTTTKEDST